jgi:hypothetical protein
MGAGLLDVYELKWTKKKPILLYLNIYEGSHQFPVGLALKK